MSFRGRRHIASDPKDSGTASATPAKRADAPVSRFTKALPETYRTTKDGDIAIVHLDHSPGKTGEVALFLPAGFDPGKPAILMPYFHGWEGGINDTLGRQRMAELAAKSGKNIAFVIPQLGQHSDIKPDFKQAAYAAKFLDEAANGLAKLYGRTHPDADAAQTAQAFHDMPVVPLSYSGGYKATLATLQLPEVKGVVLLDSMYSEAAPFTNFSKRADAPFVSVTYGPTTEVNSKDFARNAAKGTVAIAPSAYEHPVLVQNALGATLQAISVDADGQVSYAGVAEKPAIIAASRPPAPRS